MQKAIDDRGFLWEQLLRNVGLGAANGLRRKLRGRRQHKEREEKKIAIAKSWRLAATRCAVHLLPVLISITIVAINTKAIFIGINFDSKIQSETINIAFLQVAAKLQELAIIASLAAVTFEILRHELIYGDGLPLGLLVAGFEFSKISYFFSSEMLGSLKHAFYNPGKLRRIILVLYLVLVGALAVVVGPSCAVLLVPQSQSWPAGGTQFFLNGTQDYFWPTYLSANASGLQTLCSSSDAVNHGVCPSGGFHSLWAHHVGLFPENFRKIIPSYSRKLSGNDYYYSTRSTQPVLINTLALGIWNDPKLFIQPHLGVATVLGNLMQTWWGTYKQQHGLNSENVENREAISHVYSPMSSVRCGLPRVATVSDQQIHFPTSESLGISDEQNLTHVHVNVLPSRHIQFSWVLLPGQNNVSVGAVFQSPWINDNTSRIVVGCTVQANWVPARIYTDAYSFWQGFYPNNIEFEKAYPRSGIPSSSASFENRNANAIGVDSSWLDLLRPPTPLSGPGYRSWGPSTIESILEDTHVVYDDASASSLATLESWQDPSASRINLLISVIGSIFNDGLARAGLERIFNGTETPIFFKEAPKSNNTILKRSDVKPLPVLSKGKASQLSVDFSISGLSYRMTLASKLAMAALCTHIFIAITHTVWTLRKRQSSACWDSVTEVLVLAQNSKPAFSALENTAAGIRYSSTYAKKVTIRPTRLPNKNEVDHLEMIFEEENCSEDALDEDGSQEMQHWEDRLTTQPPPEEHQDASVGAQEAGLMTRRAPLHPSTWPSTQRRHVRRSSGWSEQTSRVSLSDSPLLSIPTPDIWGQGVEPPGRARVRINHEYG